ncbi:MAG: peptidyl-prolyl cis-trans isomerase [Myxococcota bacterium]|nr:peptidyl-prolyl cis-trans isomerase [Myxococcota bacterium]
MIRLSFVAALVLTPILASVAACGPGVKGGPSMNNKIGGNDVATAGGVTSPVVSAEVLAREPNTNKAQVKHILIGWQDLADAYQGGLDPRAAKRDKAAAETEVTSLVGQLAAGADFDSMMKAHSEDKGSAASARLYPVTPDAQLVIEFKQLSLRLNVGEIGVVQSDFGFHIIKRYE